MKNPFTTTFGIEPTNFINRFKESDLIISEFSAETPSNFAYLITGLRGSGKTVFMSSVSSYFKEKDDWIVVDPGIKENIIENLVSAIYETGLTKKLFIKSEFSFSFHGATIQIKGTEPVSSPYSLLKKMLAYLQKKGYKILITIDEVDNSPEIKTFVEAYQNLLREKFYVRLLMTGLYENIFKLQNEKSLTFLYRAPKIYLGPLNSLMICESYKKYLVVNDDLAKQLTEISKGYAYAYQVLGYLMFQEENKIIDDYFLIKFDQYMSEYVYDKIFSEMSYLEKNIVKFIPEHEEIKLEDLSKKVQMDLKKLSVYRDRLIKRGILYSPRYGFLRISLPRFSNYINNKIY